MGPPSDLPPRLSAAVKRELQGERVRWSGRPSPRRAFWTALPIVLFGIPWTAGIGVAWVSLFDMTTLAKLTGWMLLAMAGAGLFLLTFLFVGLVMIATPWVAAHSARNTIHLVTDRRLVTIRAGRLSTKVTTVWPADIVSIERKERPDGSGNLKLVLGAHRDSDGDKVTTQETISGVANVRGAELALAETRRDKRAA